MKTYLVMADDRPEVQDIIRRSSERFRRLNKVEGFIQPWHISPPTWNDLHSPHWVKARVWSFIPSHVDRIVWLDSDCVPVAPMDPWPDSPFAAVEDQAIGRWQDAMTDKRLAMLDRYFNAGVWIATRETIPMFHALQKMEPVGIHYEQGAFNLAVASCFPDWHGLPKSHNFMGPDMMPTDTVISHSAGKKTPETWQAIRSLLDQLERKE